MAIRRSTVVPEAKFSVGLNIILTGSKKMSPEQQDALLTVDKVRVLVTDADDFANVLLEAEAVAEQFTSGSMGYKVHTRDLEFTR